MGRKNVLEGSECEPVLQRLIAARWQSQAIALYLASRFGVEVTSSAIRHYAKRHEDEIKESLPDYDAAGALAEGWREVAIDEFVDVVGSLGQLVRLQQRRVLVEFELEKKFQKGMDSTRHEIKLLGDLLEQYHGLLQQYGIAPTPDVNVNVRGAMVFGQMPQRNVIELVQSEEERDQVISFARLVNERAPAIEQSENGSSNGKVDGE